MTNQTIYTVGGTVQAGGGIYIPRRADVELLQHCRASEFAFVLSSRQVGKSSLMVRTAQQLDRENIRSAIIDLSELGVNISVDEWYLGILHKTTEELKLKTDIFSWWSERSGLGPAQRLTIFFRDILLKEVTEPVVLFFDEIDTTLSIPFADDFFAALRAIYNARSTAADFKRLSFVMIGVATPSDLIADEKRTPFNIGHRVDLTDFTPEEALPLAGELGTQTLGLVFAWTGGHPYLTQRLCAHLSKSKMELTEETVKDSVKQLFEGEQGRQDNNLQFVRDMLTKRAPDIQRVLKTYKDIRSGKKVTDDERSIPKAHLKISGVVRRENGKLRPRNRIYERAFDLIWVKENTPPTTMRRLVLTLSFVTIIALMIAGYFAWRDSKRTPAERAAQFTSGFQSAQSTTTRLKNLAELFELNDESYSRNARQLFNGLLQPDKLALFAPSTAWGVRENQIIVVKGLYQHMENTQGENKLLEAMAQTAPPFTDEITLWLAGRKEMSEKDYYSAKATLELALTKNPENPALYYDRAQVFIGLEKDYYPNALADLEHMLNLDSNRLAAAKLLIEKNKTFSLYWNENKNNYPVLSKAIPTFVVLIDVQGVSMVFVPSGKFTMGSLSGNNDETPIHLVELPSYYIDQYEVTNAAYKLCVDAGMCQPPTDISSATRASYYGNSQFDNYPVINIYWNMAIDYCEWRGARLPTEAEWEKAARGTDERTYPWGETIDCTYANISGGQNGFCIGDTALVGNYPKGVSPYGAYDMAGNVWEWVNDWYGDTYYQHSPSSNPTGPSSGQFHVLRGGDWSDLSGAARSTFRYGYDPAYTNDNNFNGFRCARSP